MIPLNQIFYGPPGTGKTFNVTSEAEKIVNLKNLDSEDILDIKGKFERILMAIREKYKSSEFRAKSNSIYRNDRAIMWMLGYIIKSNSERIKQIATDQDIVIELDKQTAFDDGFKRGPSYWSQQSQLISQFRLVQDWRDTTHLQLNKEGVDLVSLVNKTYTENELKAWDKDCPEEVRKFYIDIFKRQTLSDFTPVLKTFFCALNMLINDELYKQVPEDRKPTDEEKTVAEKYFDLMPNTNDIKWIGHFGRILEGLGVVEEASTQANGKKFYKTTETGQKLILEIIENWEKKYPYLFKKLLSYESAIELGLIHFVTFHQSYSYEEFIEGIRPNLNDSENLNYELVDGIFKSVCDIAKEKKEYNYVVIIDEINRGNISKIFGELITLLEPSKRLYSEHNENPKEVTLPYSKSKFSVPNNVYVIGTMNTADRSITNIDTALRRRFSFKNFPPNPSLLENIKIEKNGSEIQLSTVLNVMNKRIESLLDKDHLIGHAYLMKVKNWEDLCQVFRDNLIPLLQEYFYNDWEKIALVLGDTSFFGKTDDEKFIIKNKVETEKLFGSDYTDENLDFYNINQNLQEQNYKKLSEQFFVKGFPNN